MKHLLTVVVVIACLPIFTLSQKPNPSPTPLRVTISSGFLTGKEYLDMGIVGRRGYGMGVINGMLVAPLFGAPESKVKWLNDCTEDMTDEQIEAILTKYIQDSPAEWHHSLNLLSINAMTKACPQH
jgi:hypothetical protein